MIEHKSVTNILIDLFNKYEFLPQDAYLQKTKYTFDVSVSEVFGWFLGNGRLVILNPDIDKDSIAIAKVIENQKITHVNFTPSMLESFVYVLEKINKNNSSHVKYIFIAGEELKIEFAKKIINLKMFESTQFEDLYGPTEATIYATKYSLEKLIGLNKVPIGKPLANIKALILDKNYKLQPIGVPGELFLGGEAIARGYLNKQKLTKERFIPNPFNDKEILYKTGDLARWLPNGEIEFLGRLDYQVKIRGFRIELKEIESNILTYREISKAIVVSKERSKNDNYLCGYFVCSNKIDIDDLKQHLSKFLPKYMIPEVLVQIDEIPINNSGKANIKALIERKDEVETKIKYEEPINLVENKLIGFYKEITGCNQKIGRNDDFFAIGGHSLKATKLAAEIRKEFNVEISLAEIFRNSIIKDLGVCIENTQKNVYIGIKKIPQKEYYQLSKAQKRIHFLHNIHSNSVACNMPAAVKIYGKIDIEEFENVFVKLISRHESLRTSFYFENGEVVQKIADDVSFSIKYIESKESNVENIINNFIKPFDLKVAPLLRTSIIKIDEDIHIMLIDMHHIISDGVSSAIFIDEFLKLYDGQELPEVKIQYKDYVYAQDEIINSDILRKQEQYWLDRFKGDIPMLNLPTNYERIETNNFNGEKIYFEIDKELSGDLYNLAQETNTTLYMVLLAAYNILLYKYTNQDDIIIGSPVSGRRHLQLQNIIGMFVNMLAMRNYIDKDNSFNEFLTNEVKINALNAYENQDYQFEDLVNKLNISKDINSNPIFNTVLAMQNVGSQKIHYKGINVENYNIDNKISKFDLLINVNENDDKIYFIVEFSTMIFNMDTAQNIGKHFIRILEQVAKNSNIKIADINIPHKFSPLESKILIDDIDNFGF